MSNLSFRPRPIDVNKEIPIITEEIDDFDMVVSRSVPMLHHGMEDHEAEEAHIQKAIKQSLRGQKAAEIPTPQVLIVPGYDTDPDAKLFNRPTTYIRYKDKTIDEWDQLVEYDLDSSDEEFVSKLNTTKKVLNLEKFELLMDRMEKECCKNEATTPSLEHMVKSLGTITKGITKEIFSQVYEYWSKKRQNNLLIYRLLKPPDPDDPDPNKAFRARSEEYEKFRKKGRKNDVASFTKLKQLRHEMERARTLLEMIKKRERLKKELIESIRDMFEMQCHEIRLGGEPREDLVGIESPDSPPLPSIPEKEIPMTPPTKKRKKQPSTRKKERPKELEYEFEESEDEDEIKSQESSEYSPSEGESLLHQSPKRTAIARPTATAATATTDQIESPIPSPQRFLSGLDLENFVAPSLPVVRYRRRLGRGGRVIVDRIVPRVSLEDSDEEDTYDPRIQSIVDLYRQSFHPLLMGEVEPDRLLKRVQTMMLKKKS